MRGCATGGATKLRIHPGLLRTETSEHTVVHGDGTVRNAQVLNVATSTHANGRVERRRLCGEERLGVGVADDALISHDTCVGVWQASHVAARNWCFAERVPGLTMACQLGTAAEPCSCVRYGTAMPMASAPEGDESIEDLDALHRTTVAKYHADQMCSARSR